jgi:hypothetical protein
MNGYFPVVFAEGVTAETGWPSDETLKAIGTEIVANGPNGLVKIGDRTFSEGLLKAEIRARQDEMREELGEGGP